VIIVLYCFVASIPINHLNFKKFKTINQTARGHVSF
jgi:hypothetical protein